LRMVARASAVELPGLSSSLSHMQTQRLHPLEKVHACMKAQLGDKGLAFPAASAGVFQGMPERGVTDVSPSIPCLLSANTLALKCLDHGIADCISGGMSV
jgi:hypothetical protein